MEAKSIDLHDLVLRDTDARLLEAMIDGCRRAPSADSDPARAFAELLAHARRVPDKRLPPDRVAMGSVVTYGGPSNATKRTVRLVYPADADLALRKLSVLSPIGRALLGRRSGMIAEVALRGGRTFALRILAVAQQDEARAA